ncbi:MAG TPA: MBL fold metallo-hydrolase [Ferruginibacter sp.]|jgi:L-ascorbate metabolism protein UlaG (beta-lactamase superfamily)|nr:MBL fold metallo-hydrolase [Ferruginibacter sp.]
MILTASILAVLFIVIFTFIEQPKFGKLPDLGRLKQIKNSPNFRKGRFQNINHTPDLAEGVSYYVVLKDFLFNKSSRNIPSHLLPSKKTDLLTLDPHKNVLVWFGHSSYFMQIDGKKILVDPVFSGAASPIKFTTRSFKGSDIYTTDDIPVIDYLFISHDHWDHLDYETVVKLQPKIKKVITGLGVGAHLEYWGYSKNQVIEKDWNEEIILAPGFIVNTTSARHFSGREFKRNRSLWMSFVFKTPTMKIFIGGDSGYDTHFKKIGDTFGPFDMAILECGQYNKYWKYIHMFPEQVVQAGIDLQATKIFPVHWSKFSLATHAWDEPIIRIRAESVKRNVPLITPIIGEEVNLKAFL